jgi:hypothetical protein
MKERFGTHSAAFILLGICAMVAALLALRLGGVLFLRNAQGAACAQ